ncbi:MAG: 30S ribosomal protein S8 [Patescibacteria group bacterium]
MFIEMLTKIKNAQAVKKENVKVNYSKINESILKILSSGGYIDGFEKKGQGIKRILDIKLKYENNAGAINEIKLISKPSRHIYMGYKEIKLVKRGYGLMVISTPSGIMNGKDARKMKVGGEALFEIW